MTRKFIIAAISLLFPYALATAQISETGTQLDVGEPCFDDIPLITVPAVDTIDTADKYLKIILYEDHTWEYFEIPRPSIDTAGLYEGWDVETIHAFQDVKLENLPDSVDLCLYDDSNPYCVPYSTKVLSGFKYRKKRPHKGVDLPLALGDTVRAAFNGVVRYVGGGKATGGYGNLVVIRHANGLETYYAHLSKRLVEENETVAAGEVIGLGGSTGRSTGPHLHFETRYMGKAFDPERVFDFESGTARDSMFTLKKHFFNINSHYGQTDKQSVDASKAQYYKVRKGDTLGKIASRYGTTVNALCRLNGIKSNKVLRIGQSLRVR